jgi:hypothetical protein
MALKHVEGEETIIQHPTAAIARKRCQDYGNSGFALCMEHENVFFHMPELTYEAS